MNDSNKRINANLSSLLSLKAELLRKHEEVNKARSSHLIENFVPKQKINKSVKNEVSSKAGKDEINHSESYEDSEMLQRSKKILEAKSKFYDRMTESGGALNSDENCLVMFNQKKQNCDKGRNYQQSGSSSDDSEAEVEVNDKEKSADWVEYTECLGRTRKCLKKDVEFFKKKDGELAQTVAERNEMNGINTSARLANDAQKWFMDTKGELNLPMKATDDIKDDDTMSMMSKLSKIDEIRQNWEKQEAENINKDYVHYQGVLFDEARTHGVGYYAFSTDESERSKQQKELEATRLKTLESQKERKNQRMSREKIIVERVKAAKNRQRARLGLPPLEDNPEPTEQELYDKSVEEKLKRKAEKSKLKKEQKEKLLSDERKKHVRPWDKHKDGVRKTRDSNEDSEDDEWTYRPEKEPMSQEQWNEKKRSERNMEFAPLQQNEESFHNTNSFKQPDPAFDEYENKSLNFTTKNRKPFVVRHVDESFDCQDQSADHNRKRVEIAPPSNLDSDASTSKQKRLNPDLASSITAGLKFLREQSDKGTLSTKMKWTSNVDY